MKLNIGGGHYYYQGWRNLDAIHGARLDAQTTLPDALHTVYSSHCFEHLDDATVSRVLSECRRALTADGLLVLKIPDFDQVLERWRARDGEYFKQWGMEKLPWARDLNSKASMIFCGYWNDAYGDEFGNVRNVGAPKAYHGPAMTYPEPPCNSPHEISAMMRADSPAGVHFNHQNAWSRAEFVDLLDAHGLRVLSTDRADILQRLSGCIPELGKQAAISLYAVAA